MKDTLCFPPALWSDERVLDLDHSQHRMLLSLCALAARGRPWGRVRPLSARALTRLLSGASGRQANRSQVEKFLHAMEDLDLVERTDDGAIWVTLFEDEEGEDVATQAGPIQPDERTPAAKRQQRHRERLRREREALPVTPGHAQAGVTHEGDSVTKSVTRHASDGPVPAVEGVTGSVTRGVTPSRASDNVNVKNVSDNVSEDSEKTMFSSDSGDVNNVTPNVAARHAVTPPVTPSSPTGVTPRPFHTCPAAEVPSRRRADVGAVIALTGDDKSRGRYVQIWNHLQTAGRLDLWSEAIQVFSDRKKTGKLPPQEKWGGSMDTTFGNLCRSAGIPIPQGSPDERAEAQAGAQALRRSLQDGGASQ